MATRLYLTSSASAAAPVSPAYDASWEVTASAIRRILNPEKVEAALASSAAASALNTPAGAVDVLIAQFVSPPISGTPTISGAIKGQVRALSSNAAADLRMQCVIRVVSGDGATVHGILIASDATALSNEFNTALRNIRIPKGGSTVPSSITASDGDRIVVEIGYRKHESATTSRTGTFSLGAVAGGTDLAEDETTTTANVPWIEFADTLTFQPVETRVSQIVAQAAITPDTVETRVSQIVAQAAITPDTVETRVSQIVVQAAIVLPAPVVRVTKVGRFVAVTDFPAPDIRATKVGRFVAVVNPTYSAGSDLSLDAIVRAVAGSDLSLDAEIQPGTTASAGSDLEVDAAISALAGQDLGLDAEVHSSAGSDLAIDAAVASTVGSDLETDAGIGVATGSNLEIDSSISGLSGSDLELDAPIAVSVGSDLEIDAGISVASGNDLEIDAGIRAATGSDLDLDSAIAETVGADLSIDAEILPGEIIFPFPVGSELQIDAGIRQVSGSDLETDAEVRATVGSDLSIDAAIQSKIDDSVDAAVIDLILRRRKKRQPQLVGRDLRFGGAVHRTAGSELWIDSGILPVRPPRIAPPPPRPRPVGRDLTISAAIVNLYDLNRDILLAEIDPDLAFFDLQRPA